MRSHGNSMHWQDLLCLSLLLELLQAGLCPVTASHFRTTCHAGYHKFPTCIDTPGAYLCECGPGFVWNSEMCVAKAADSRLEFLDVKPAGYTLLLGKTFPQLSAFTISMWVKTAKIERDRVYLSYSINDKKPQIMIEGGKSFNIYVAGEMVKAPVKVEPDIWQHLAFTWSNKRGDWAWYVDGQRVARNDKLATNVTLPVAGEFVLGQAPRSRDTLHFEEDRMYIGDLSHVNIWSYPMNKSQIEKLAGDCTFMQCGDAVQWVDFRSGTRGSMKLRWPSGIFATGCDANLEEACDRYCSHTIGPQCNQDTAGNIEWPRTPAGESKSLPCPGKFDEEDENFELHLVNRTCLDTGGLHGTWDIPILSQCASREQLELRMEITEFHEKPNINGSVIIHLTKKLDNYTKTFLRKTNPIDLAIDIHCLDMLVDAQAKTLQHIAWSESILRFTNARLVYPTYDETYEFSQIVADILNAIMDTKNEVAWKETKPRGVLAVDLMRVIQKFTDVLATSLNGHMRRKEIGPKQASISALTHNFVLDVKAIQLANFRGLTFPHYIEELELLVPDHFSLPRELFSEVSLPPELKHVIISSAKYNTLGRLLPNHPEPIKITHFRDKAKENAHKEDNVNTALLFSRIHLPEAEQLFHNMTTPILINLKYDKPFNVSNPECVTLRLSNISNDFDWSSEGCQIISYTYDGARCQCRHPGIFALTTDMYDVNWNCCKERIFHVTVPAYIGYIINVAFCIASLVLYSHFKCVSDTVNVHRNLAMSIILAQTSYVVGVARREDEGMCRGFAIVLHYFFTSEFCWLCNEAFNLYVEVANSIHVETQQQRPMLRYYIIGWVFPGALVGALVGSNWDNYFADDICWVNLDQIWLFVGPVAGVWAITCFVLTFTGKDIVESSYSKDKQANKVVSNHCKGCWVQITLILISWAFAFVSVKMVGLILQVLYAFFVILQGSFFFVFFCVLNGEVATALRERRARLGLAVSTPSFSSKYSVYRRAPTSPTTKKDRTESTEQSGQPSGSLASASAASSVALAGGSLNSSTNHFEMRNRKSDHGPVEVNEELVTTV